MDELGQLLHSERTRLGIDQAALALQLGVTQQTVSRWEKGQARPRPVAVTKLALTLGVPRDELDRALGGTDVADSRPTAEEAVRPLVSTLPLQKLTYAEFERFVTELLQLRLGSSATVERLGGQGDDQLGYDILVRYADGRLTGVQCKRVKQFGKKAMQDAVAAAELNVTDSVVAVSVEVRSAARFEALEHSFWSLWDEEDLSRQVRNELSREAALRLVDSYFPGMRESFLGVRAPSPWLTVDEYFRSTPTSMLDHRQEAIGRSEVLDKVRDWARRGPSPIGRVVGRGGIGKSKLLFDLVNTQPSDDPVNFRFLDVQQQPSREDFEQLPTGKQLVVVIDDAHDVDNIAAIAAQLRGHDRSAKLLLATRPFGELHIDAELSRLNEAKLTDSRWELEDLDLHQALTLVSQLIGRSEFDPVTKNLASVSTDLPFVAVVGAKLLQSGSINSKSFSSDATLRRDVLGRFTELSIASGDSAETAERRQILAALAAYQPVPLGDESLQAAMTKLTGISSWDLVSARIRDLEDRGLVLRRGASVRVVPDMLGDIVLAQAAYDERSNVATTYLKRAQEAAEGLALQHLIINGARMDWQVRDGRPTRSDMLSDLWDNLRGEFVAAEPAAQLELMQVVERIAFYQPDRALALMTDVLQLPDPPETVGPADRWTLTPRDVVRAVPGVLRNVAYNLAQLDGCLALLWSLAQSDHRPTNQHPDHPMRVLTEIASLRAGKPFEYNDRLIDVVEGWFDQPYDARLSPFDVLEPILASEGSDEVSSSRAISIRSFSIDPNSVHDLRQRVVELAVSQARHANPVLATRAIVTLEQAVRYPMGLAGRKSTDQEVDAWTDEFIPTIDVLGDIGTERGRDPVVRLGIRRALGWLADVPTAPARAQAAARQALSRLSSSLEDDVALCLHDGWGRLGMREGKTYEEAETERQIRFKEVAEDLVRDRNDQDILELVERRLAAERASFGNGGEAGRFLGQLFELRPDLAAAVCNHVANGQLPELITFADLALAVLFGIPDDRAMPLAETMLAAKSLEFDRTVASALSWRRGRRERMVEGEFDLLVRLASHDDEAIRAMIGRAVFLVGLSDRVIALDLLSHLKFGCSGKVASEALSAMMPQGPINPWRETKAPLRKAILDQLVECRSIDFYEVLAAISALSAVDPLRVTNMLIARVDHQETGDDSDYEALPYRIEPGLQVAGTSKSSVCLARIKDWLTAVGARRAYYRGDEGAKLFGLAAGTWDAQAIAVLSDFDLDNLEASATAVARILAHAPRRVIFDNVDLVTQTLRYAKQIGPDTVKLVSALMSSAYNVTFTSSWGGQPAPEDVLQRDRAVEIASQLPRRSAESMFYQGLADNADALIRFASDRHDDLPDGRDWR